MDEQTYESVRDALEDTPGAAENMKVRSVLMQALQDHVAGWSMPQAEAARRLGITQPRLNDLLRGKIHTFSIDALVNMLVQAGLRLHVEELEQRRAKPASGKFNVRVDPDLCRAAQDTAASLGVSLNEMVAEALKAYIESRQRTV